MNVSHEGECVTECKQNDECGPAEYCARADGRRVGTEEPSPGTTRRN